MTWPTHISTIVAQPTVSWVTAMMPQETRKQRAPRRWARSESVTVATPRAAATCRATAITVLVPYSQASTTFGASVSATSQSGITVISSTWWVPSTPFRKVISTKGRLRSAARGSRRRPGRAASSATATAGTTGSGRGGSGSRVTQ